MKKHRKKYRHDPGRKLEHPMLKKVEAANLERWRVEHVKMMDEQAHGTPWPDMIKTLADVICPAIKSMEGYEDPDNIGDVMVRGMEVLADMAKDGYRWDARQRNVLKEAVGYAVQVTNGMPVTHLAKAVFWSRQVAATALKESATCE